MNVRAAHGYVVATGGIWYVLNSSALNAGIQYQTNVVREGVWHNYSIGPFTTVGSDYMNFSTSLRHDLAINKYVIGPRTCNDTPIGYPPLHVHHARIEERSSNAVLITLNADSPHQINRAGIDLHDHVLVARNPRLTAIIHDIRQDKGLQLIWNFTIRILEPQYSDTFPRQSLYITGHQRSSIGFDGLRVLTQEDSVFVYKGVFPFSGELLPSTYLHTHTSTVRGSGLMFAMPIPATLSDVSRGCQYSPLRLGFVSNERLRSDLIARYSDAFVCESIGRSILIGNGRFSAHPATYCRNYSFHKGEELTLVNFLTPVHASRWNMVEIHSEWLISALATDGKGYFVFSKHISEKQEHCDMEKQTSYFAILILSVCVCFVCIHCNCKQSLELH